MINTNKPNSLFCVVALHNTGHGECATPLQITSSKADALRTAMDADSRHEFEFHEKDAYVAVYRMEIGKAYKNPSRVAIDENPIIFVRRKTRDGWREEYFD